MANKAPKIPVSRNIITKLMETYPDCNNVESAIRKHMAITLFSNEAALDARVITEDANSVTRIDGESNNAKHAAYRVRNK